jgi:photosystem II stability/assembly factor-like uncharacterized protein
MKNPNLNVLLTVLFLSCSFSYSQTWVQQNTGTIVSVYDISFVNTNTGYAGCSSGLVLKTTNSGVNWIHLITGFTFTINKVKFFDADFGVAGGEKIIKTTNGGQNWSLVRDTVYANDIHFQNQNEWWLCSSSPHANIKTTNQGSTWTSIGSTDFIQTSIFFLNQNTGWLAGKFVTGSFVPTHVSKSTNGGSQWSTQFSQTSFQNNGWVYDILFTDQNMGHALYWDFFLTRILRTTNSGLNWLETLTPMRKLKNLFFINQSIGWACGDSGFVYKTMNSGNNWAIEQISPGIHLNAVTFVNNETGWVCAAGGIILKTTIGGITAVEQTGTNIPERYSLSQNYPNPFNPVTRIIFDVPKSSFTKLIIYDQIGGEVEKLVNEQLSPGSYKYEWNAADYPSGIYYYRLQAGEFSETKKMVLIK